MTQPDYPLPVLPSYELYQLAHIATFLADGLARHHRARAGGEKAAAVRRLGGGRAVLERALGVTTEVPVPLDTVTFHAARGLVAAGPRWAEVVSLAPVGQEGWGVVGYVPGLGPVGARTPSRPVADAVHHHVLTQPASELAPWAVTDKPRAAPRVPDRVDLAGFVRDLDPFRDRDRAVARHLRGLDRRSDAAIRERFAGVDLDAPLVVRPPAPRPRPAARPVQRAAAGSRHLCGIGPQVTTRSVPSAPATSAGP